MTTFFTILALIINIALGVLVYFWGLGNGITRGKEEANENIIKNYYVINKKDYQHDQNLLNVISQLQDLFEGDEEEIIDAGEY